MTKNTRPRSIAFADDDASVRKSLDGLLRGAEFELETFASAEEFLS